MSIQSFLSFLDFTLSGTTGMGGDDNTEFKLFM